MMLVLQRALFALFAIPMAVLILASGVLGFAFAPLAWVLTGEWENGWLIAGVLIMVWDDVAAKLAGDYRKMSHPRSTKDMTDGN